MALFSHFVGRIGKKEVIDKNGKKFLSMDVATDIYSQGEVKTMWIRVRSNMERHIKWSEKAKVGSLILVEGTQVEPSTWSDKKTGEPRAQTVIIANIITYASGSGKKKDKPEDNQEEQPAINTSEQMPIPAPADKEDDLPF